MILNSQKLLITETFVLKFELISDKLGRGSGQFKIDVDFKIESDGKKETESFTPFVFEGKFNSDEVFASALGKDFKWPSMSLTNISKKGLATISFSEKFDAIEDLSALSAKKYLLKGEKKSAIEVVGREEEG